jgi:hypothetical protein
MALDAATGPDRKRRRSRHRGGEENEDRIRHEGMNYPGLADEGWGQPGAKLGGDSYPSALVHLQPLSSPELSQDDTMSPSSAVYTGRRVFLPRNDLQSTTFAFW